MSEIDLSEKFPDMRPVRRAPSLTTVNGIGTTLAGSRDYDSETGTYVKTHCLCVLFIPLVALGAYRVADSPDGGWYFLGKVPLSRFARAWNFLLLLALLGGAGALGWHSYTSSPEYQARRRLAEADSLAGDGQVLRAAELYRELMKGTTSHAGTARERLRKLVESPPESAEESAGVFRVAAELQRDNRPVVDDLYGRGVELANRLGRDDPRGALAVADAVSPLAPRRPEHLALERRLLERLVAREPDSSEPASRLAVLYEQQGQTRRCKGLLAPHAGRLGTLDGAGILGRIYAAEGKYDRAVAQLKPFVGARLPQFQATARAYNNAVDAAAQRLVSQLNSRAVADFDYAGYEAAPEPRKKQMVGEYVLGKLNADPEVRGAAEARAAQAGVGRAAMELGTALLHRAQAERDPEARRRQLEEAEKTFLSIREAEGQTDEYRVRLGQVYYWLGKHAEGKKLFDELLKAHGRSTDVLLGVGHVLREVGASSEARALLEEAYGKEKDQAKKYRAALARSLLFTDLDDQITWLGRADPEEAEVKASLSTCRGRKAFRDGKDKEAAGHYHRALATYAGMVESPATLNNSALVHLAQFQLTRERAELTRATDKLDRAVALKPTDSILLLNAAETMLASAADDVIGPALDLKRLKRQAGLEVLAYLYRDRAGKERYVERLRDHPAFSKGLAYLEKQLVLAPRRPNAYGGLATLYAYTRDLERLRKVRDRLRTVELDLADTNRQTREFYQGKNDARKLDERKKSLARQEAVLGPARKKGGATLAAAAGGVVRARLALAEMGQPIDADALVKLAEEGHAAGPSEGTTSDLVAALLLRAHQALVKGEKGYADLAARTQRSLGHRLLTYVLGREGPLRAKALAQPEVARAMNLRLGQVKAFPESRGPWDWAFLRAAHPKEAEAVARFVREDALGQLEREIDAVLSPLSASAALDQHWALRIAGKEAEAESVLKRAAARGVPLPVAGG